MVVDVKYAVTWTYREGAEPVYRELYQFTREPCIEAARLIFSSPYSSDIKVLEVDTGISVPWEASRIGEVVVRA